MQIDSTTWRSPNYDARTDPISAIVVHSCEGKPAGDEQQSSLPWLCKPSLKVSCHYYITRAGVIYCLVDDTYRAWHAGEGAIGSNTDPNDISLGVELEHRAGAPAYSTSQLAALTWLCQTKMAQYSIPTSRIVSHRAVAPGRKFDPTDWPEAAFRAWADALDEAARGPVALHGCILTYSQTLDTLEDALIAGHYSALKFVATWGLPASWDLPTIARACAMSAETVIRTEAGDPSSGHDYPHPEEVTAQIAPWYDVRRHNLWIEIGNEPNSGSLDPHAYAYYLDLAITACRSQFPKAKLIAPALLLDRGNPSQWLDICDDVFRRCDAVGVHIYAYKDLAADDTGQRKTAEQLYSRFGSMPRALTEYGINDPPTVDSVKGQRYAAYVRSLPAPYVLATFYHVDTFSKEGNNAAYAIDQSGHAAYGQAWRGAE